MRRCLKEDFKAVRISIENKASCEISKLPIILTIVRASRIRTSLKNTRSQPCACDPYYLYGDQALLDAIYTEISNTMKQFGLEKVPVSVACYHLAKLITVRLISATVAYWLTRSPTDLKVADSSLPTAFIFFNNFSLV